MKEMSPDEIRSFQQERGLHVTGELNEQTVRALDESRWKLGDRSLYLQASPFMRGDDVAALQSRLTEMGFNCGRVDAIFGVMTEAAVKEFQQSVGVKVDGKCGPATIIALLRLTKIVSGGAPAALRESAAQKNRGPALANKVIVIDPASEEHEKEAVYDIAQRLEGRLLALGASVFLTRGVNNNPSEAERITFTNQNGADLLISLHVDHHKNSAARGVATFFYGHDQHGIHSIVGERFASLVQREICARTDFLNCRTHAKTWDSLRLTKAPAVRVDLGYASNDGDADRLARPDFRDTVAESFVIAIQRLYLAAEDDAKTGTLRISDLRSAGIRR
ncbi:N-acetylmuramoyl-L-alanine amidase [Candidatus Planktophila dulcis]|jgi:N-acetylmuramoyl-L-alanine amidase|uniref:N-acetylmuramoyl-L-alanine amidase n=1 Tax=Candidatus Planktophila dulcis TaxID=1884914 RepID=UPI003BEF0A69